MNKFCSTIKKHFIKNAANERGVRIIDDYKPTDDLETLSLDRRVGSLCVFFHLYNGGSTVTFPWFLRFLPKPIPTSLKPSFLRPRDHQVSSLLEPTNCGMVSLPKIFLCAVTWVEEFLIGLLKFGNASVATLVADIHGRRWRRLISGSSARLPVCYVKKYLTT